MMAFSNADELPESTKFGFDAIPTASRARKGAPESIPGAIGGEAPGLPRERDPRPDLSLAQALMIGLEAAVVKPSGEVHVSIDESISNAVALGGEPFHRIVSLAASLRAEESGGEDLHVEALSGRGVGAAVVLRLRSGAERTKVTAVSALTRTLLTELCAESSARILNDDGRRLEIAFGTDTPPLRTRRARNRRLVLATRCERTIAEVREHLAGTSWSCSASSGPLGLLESLGALHDDGTVDDVHILLDDSWTTGVAGQALLDVVRSLVPPGFLIRLKSDRGPCGAPAPATRREAALERPVRREELARILEMRDPSTEVREPKSCSVESGELGAAGEAARWLGTTARFVA